MFNEVAQLVKTETLSFYEMVEKEDKVKEPVHVVNEFCLMDMRSAYEAQRILGECFDSLKLLKSLEGRTIKSSRVEVVENQCDLYGCIRVIVESE